MDYCYNFLIQFILGIFLQILPFQKEAETCPWSLQCNDTSRVHLRVIMATTVVNNIIEIAFRGI